MVNIQTDNLPLNRVTAVFADGSQSFPLPQGATLEQIADRIDRLGTRQERETVGVPGRGVGGGARRRCA
jgi:hypothetical protein